MRSISDGCTSAKDMASSVMPEEDNDNEEDNDDEREPPTALLMPLAPDMPAAGAFEGVTGEKIRDKVGRRGDRDVVIEEEEEEWGRARVWDVDDASCNVAEEEEDNAVPAAADKVDEGTAVFDGVVKYVFI